MKSTSKQQSKATKKVIVIRKAWPRVRDHSTAEKPLFIVDARPHGGREAFATEQDAMIRAEQFALDLENKGVESMGFPTADRLMASACIKKLRPFGKTLEDATNHFVAWLEAEQHRNESQSVDLCADDYEAAKQVEFDRGEFAAKSLYEVKSKMKPLRAALGGLPIMSVTEEAVRTLLDSMPISARSRNNYRVAFSGFFTHCIRRKFVDANPVAAISIKVKNGEVKILSVPQAKALMKAATASKESAHVVPFAAISLFAGLRPGEVEQLRWENVCLKTNSIEVLPHTSKTRDRRFVPIEPTLRQWLKDHKRTTGRIIGASHQKVWRGVRAAAEIEGGNQDILRHTYASYWLALRKNRTELAEHMGNSPAVIKAHYRRPILESVAKAFWALTPKAIK